MAPKASLSTLFHPKKGVKKEALSPSPRKTSTTPRPKIVQVEDEDELKLPEGPFQEFRLMSSALNGWKYDVMKFDSRKPVDISTWKGPIKLNRKELRRESTVNGVPEAVGPMLGPDGKPVIGSDGKMVMVDAEGRPIHPTDESPGGTSRDSKSKGAPTNGKKKFQKKTRQVFFVPENVRQLRREERYPWVMEDSTQNEVWVGQLEEVTKSETHAFFMPAANDIFKFVPAHRWYKFQKKLKHDLPTDTANVESLYSKNQKKDPQTWLHNRNGKGPSNATAAMFKAESEGRALSGGSSLVHNAAQSLGPGGRKLKVVDSGRSDLFGDDDEDGDAKRRRDKEYGGEGDLDEMVYEEDFADDDEKMEAEDNDEEAKEIEERLKREYKSANKQREGYVDESDEEESGKLTKQGEAMKKLIRNREGNDAYDSDDEKNPYVSSEEEEEEEEELPVASAEPLTQQQPPQADSRSGSQPPSSTGARTQNGSKVGSRANSPVSSPPLGGHSIVAKRATSPKVPKVKANNASSGNSPLASGATSPAVSRATSPVAGANGTGSRAGSPAAQNPAIIPQKPSNKRKATDDLTAASPTSPNATGNSVPPKTKKRKSHGASVTTNLVPVGELEDQMVIEWLKTTPNASTRDCIQHFTPYLTDDAKKMKFTTLVKEVAQLKGGVLVLRNAYRSGGSAAASPAPTGLMS